MTYQTIILYALAAALFVLACYQMKTINVLDKSRTYLRGQIKMITSLTPKRSRADD